MLDKFNKEHTHTEDEVRFILQGSGVFHINPGDKPVFGIEVWSGDMINTLGAIGLTSENGGFVHTIISRPSGGPHHLTDAVHEGYEPLCLGPTYLDATNGASS